MSGLWPAAVIAALFTVVVAWMLVARVRGSERERRIRQDLRHRRHTLQSVLDNMGEGVALADERGRLTLFNPMAERILGIGTTDTPPERWSSVYGLFREDRTTPIPPGELPLARAIAGEAVHEFEMFVRNPGIPNGIFIRVTATPVRDQHDNVKGGVAVFRDISEVKRTDDALRESERRFRQLAESIREVFWIRDPTASRMHYVSPAYEQIWGRPTAELYESPRSWLESVHPEDRARVEQALDKQALGSYDVEYRILKPDGSERWIWDRGFPVRNERGDLISMAGLAEDLTERREADEDHRVRELAAHLQQALENERTHLAREIHDELGQALTGLKFQASYLLRTIPAAQAETHERLHSMGQLIDATIQSMRTLAAQLRPQILDDLGLVEAIRWQAHEFKERTGIPCELDLPPEEIRWTPDRSTAMFRIFQESLTNVARHAEASRVRAQLSCDSDSVTLIVRDDGRGIAHSEVAHSRSFGLMGMRERVRMFDGTIQIQGIDGQGTTVHVTIPSTEMGENRVCP